MLGMVNFITPVPGFARLHCRAWIETIGFGDRYGDHRAVSPGFIAGRGLKRLDGIAVARFLVAFRPASLPGVD